MEYKVIDHFKNKEPIVSEIYEKLISECEKFGTVYQSPKKTSIHLDAKAGFAGVYTRKDCLLLHIHTDFDIDNLRIEKTEKISANRYKHIVRIMNPQEIDKQIIDWLESAYKLKVKMDNITKGLIAGLAFGIASIIPMFFMEFEDKKKAIIASFINRFAIGFIIFNIDLPIAGWLKGLLVGSILSLPDALITKAFKPIMGLGIVGGIICGLLA